MIDWNYADIQILGIDAHPYLVSFPIIKDGNLKSILFAQYKVGSDEYKLDVISDDIFNMTYTDMANRFQLSKAKVIMTGFTRHEVFYHNRLSKHQPYLVDYCSEMIESREICFVTHCEWTNHGGDTWQTADWQFGCTTEVWNCSGGSGGTPPDLNDFIENGDEEESNGGGSDDDDDDDDDDDNGPPKSNNYKPDELCEKQIDEMLVNYVNNIDIADPCDPNKDVVNEAIIAMNESGDCGEAALEAAFAGVDKIKLPKNFDTDCPCFNEILNTLLSNDSQNNWYCDLVTSINNNPTTTTHLVLVDGDKFQTERINGSNIKIRIPKKYCTGKEGEDNVFEEVDGAMFIHEFMHGYIWNMMNKKYPNSLPSDFFLLDPISGQPNRFNLDYWEELVREHNNLFPGDPISGNHHAIFFQYFKDKIATAFWELNGKVGDKSDYEYYAHLILNSSQLVNSPWAWDLGLKWIDEDTNQEMNFNISNYEEKWNNIPGGGFNVDC